MPPLPGKAKKGGRDSARRSRSRNTTPSSAKSVPVAGPGPTHTAYLETDIARFLVPATTAYEDILEKFGAHGSVPDIKALEQIVSNLKELENLASIRHDTCYEKLHVLSQQRKEYEEESRMREEAEREAKERERVKREEEQMEEAKTAKLGKIPAKPKKRKEPGGVPEERPLTHGAHGLARQDGVDVHMEGTFERISFVSPPKQCTTPRRKSVCVNTVSYWHHHFFSAFTSASHTRPYPS